MKAPNVFPSLPQLPNLAGAKALQSAGGNNAQGAIVSPLTPMTGKEEEDPAAEEKSRELMQLKDQVANFAQQNKELTMKMTALQQREASERERAQISKERAQLAEDKLKLKFEGGQIRSDLERQKQELGGMNTAPVPTTPNVYQEHLKARTKKLTARVEHLKTSSAVRGWELWKQAYVAPSSTAQTSYDKPNPYEDYKPTTPPPAYKPDKNHTLIPRILRYGSPEYFSQHEADLKSNDAAARQRSDRFSDYVNSGPGAGELASRAVDKAFNNFYEKAGPTSFFNPRVREQAVTQFQPGTPFAKQHPAQAWAFRNLSVPAANMLQWLPKAVVKGVVEPYASANGSVDRIQSGKGTVGTYLNVPAQAGMTALGLTGATGIGKSLLTSPAKTGVQQLPAAAKGVGPKLRSFGQEMIDRINSVRKKDIINTMGAPALMGTLDVASKLKGDRDAQAQLAAAEGTSATSGSGFDFSALLDILPQALGGLGGLGGLFGGGQQPNQPNQNVADWLAAAQQIRNQNYQNPNV